MSFLGSLVKKVGHVIAAPVKGTIHAVTDPGAWAKNIGNQATDPKTIAGLLAAAALPGVGGLLGGSLGGIGGAVGSALGSIPGVGAVTGAIGSGLGKVKSVADAVGDSGIGDFARTLNGGQAITAGNLAGDAQSTLGKVGGFLTGNGGLNALGAAQGVTSILDAKKASDYAKKAVGTVEDSYNSRAPLRAQGIAGMLNPQTADLSALHGIAGSLKPNPLSAKPLPSGQITPGALASFAAPERAKVQSLQSILQNDSGNPYARKLS